MRRAFAALLLLGASVAYAAVPQRLNYQGKLGNAAGDPLSGTYSFRFKLFAAETGGAALFSEDVTGANAVSVVNGIYTVQIGSFTTGGIPYGVFNGPDLYLEVDVNAGANLTGAETLAPRERLNSAAWAVHALGAERLGTGAVIATFTSAGNLTAPFGVTAGTVTIDDGSATGRLASRNGLDFYSTTSGLGQLAGLLQGSGNATPNYITLGNINPGFNPTVGVAGGDSNIGLDIRTKGTGDLVLLSAPGERARLLGSSGYFGVGTNAPAAALHVSSAATVGSTPVFIVSSGVAAGQELLRVQRNGNVGIGTAVPSKSLHVLSTGGGGIEIEDLTSPYMHIRRDASNEWYQMAAPAGSNTLEFRPGNALNASVLSMMVGGNVGISTNAPAATLDVDGSASFGSGALKSTFTSVPSNSTYALRTSSGINVGGAGGVVAAFFSGNGAALTGISASDNTKVAKTGDSMSGPLTVLGSSIVVINNDAAQAFSFAVTSATDRGVYHLYVATTGRVDLNAGVFTVGGASLVVVNGGAAVGATNPAFIGASLSLQGRTFQVFNGAANAQISIRSAANAAIWSESGNGFAGRRLFFQQHFGVGNQIIWRNASETTGATNQDNILVLTSTGGVGIGIQPNARLHVSSASTNAADNIVLVSTTNGTATTNLFRVQANGNVFAHGAMTGGGADVAEMYAAQPEVEPGDVVEFSPSGRLRRADESSRRVMGIISSNPGTLLGWDINRQEMPEHRPLALAGRVPVKFSDENGAARRGDALTPASVPGFARRANAGELVIGSVLEDAGPGKVLAYVRSPDPYGRAELLELRTQNENLRRDLDELRRAVMKGREGGR